MKAKHGMKQPIGPEANENGNTMVQNLRNAAKAVPRGKFIAT